MRLAQVGLIFHAGLLITCFALKGGNASVSASTVILSVLLDGVLLGALAWRDAKTYAHLTLLVWVIGIHILPRITGYLLLGENAIRTPFEGRLESMEVNKAIAYLVVGSAALTGGFKLGSIVFGRIAWDRGKGEKRDYSDIIFSPGIVGATWTIVLAVECYFLLWKNVSVFNLREATASGLWLIHFFSSDTIALFTLVMAISSERREFARSKTFLFGITMVYLTIMTLYGSRGGAMRLASMIGIVIVGVFGDVKVSMKQLLVFMFGLLLMGAVLYPIGSLIRGIRAGILREEPGVVRLMDRWGMYRDRLNMKRSRAEENEFVERRLGHFSGLRGKEGRTWKKYAYEVMNRLGTLDYVVHILSGKGGSDELSEYMNLQYAAKNFLNSAVIGTPFPEAEISTSRVMPIVFRGKSVRHVRENYLSETWTIWGLSYVMMGWWGGVVGMLVFGAAMQMGLEGIRMLCGGYKNYGVSYYLFGSYVAFLSMGIDHWLTAMLYFSLSSVTTIVLMLLLDHGRSVGARRTK